MHYKTIEVQGFVFTLLSQERLRASPTSMEYWRLSLDVSHASEPGWLGNLSIGKYEHQDTFRTLSLSSVSKRYGEVTRDWTDNIEEILIVVNDRIKELLEDEQKDPSSDWNIF